MYCEHQPVQFHALKTLWSYINCPIPCARHPLYYIDDVHDDYDDDDDDDGDDDDDDDDDVLKLAHFPEV